VAEIVREGSSLRVVLVDGGTAAPERVVSEVKQALLETDVDEVVIELPGEEAAPDRAVVAELMAELSSETLARGVPLRFHV
jgi:hypothetical protein